ncbi:MAG: hypothetical protein JWN48_5749 [Myxococcaceae bacterium]|nr:hypothetical protein [Myxococcaceae bacterium]
MLLLALHRGEFWPFSIYPMFSRGGRAWSRPLVRDVSETVPTSWEAGALAGRAFPLDRAGLDQNDLGKLLVLFQDRLEPDEASLLEGLFAGVRMQHRLLIYRVSGRLAESGAEVVLEQHPILLIDRAGARSLKDTLR